jgi:hypothetical protein
MILINTEIAMMSTRSDLAIFEAMFTPNLLV